MGGVVQLYSSTEETPFTGGVPHGDWTGHAIRECALTMSHGAPGAEFRILYCKFLILLE